MTIDKVRAVRPGVGNNKSEVAQLKLKVITVTSVFIKIF